MVATPATLVRCETFRNQTYVSAQFRFTITCPTGFWWQTFDSSPNGALFSARTVEDRYKDGYPAGEVGIHIWTFGKDNLRDWISGHIGPAMSTDANHIWDSTGNVGDVVVAGTTGVAFDYVFTGPESPNNFHAEAVVINKDSVFVIDWWTYDPSGYGPSIEKVFNTMVASLKFP